MDLKILRPENALVRLILEQIKSFDWEDIKLTLSFKGRKTPKEETFGLGFEAREFKVDVAKKVKLKYVSPRENKKMSEERNLHLERLNSKKGGEALKRKWARTRRLQEMRKVAGG